MVSPFSIPAAKAGYSGFTLATIGLVDTLPHIRPIRNNNTKAVMKLFIAPAIIIRNLCHTGLLYSILSFGILLLSSASSPAKDTKPPIGISLRQYSVSPPFFL